MKKSITSIVFITAILAMSIGLAADLKQSKSKPEIGISTGTQQSPSSNGIKTLGVPFAANCASGFSKLGEATVGGLDVNWFVCGTPVIKCPAQLQNNGKYASVTPKAIVKTVGGNPDGGEVRFHVQYKCDYSFTPIPEG
jgi:hypothetical protein